MVAFVVAETAFVVTAKVALVVPAGTVTDAGMLTDESLLDKETTVPPVGAGALSVTVPIKEVPPATLAELRLTAERDRAVPRLRKTSALPLLLACFHVTYAFSPVPAVIVGLETVPTMETG